MEEQHGTVGRAFEAKRLRARDYSIRADGQPLLETVGQRRGVRAKQIGRASDAQRRESERVQKDHSCGNVGFPFMPYAIAASAGDGVVAAGWAVPDRVRWPAKENIV
jgi:hypothetical protein